MSRTSAIPSALARLAGASARRPRSAMLILVVLTAVAALYATLTFRIDSDTEGLIRQDTDWRQEFDRFQATFPMLVDTALVVVSSASWEGVDRALRDLTRELGNEPLVTSVYAPGADPFLRDRMLLFLEPDELDALITELAGAQPAIARLAADPSLRGLLELVGDGIRAREDGQLPATLEPLVTDLGTSARDVAAGGRGEMRWMDRLLGTEDRQRMHYGIILVQGVIDFDDAMPYGRLMERLRTLADRIDVPADVRIRLTGEVPLAHEEVEAATAGIGLAGTVALLLLGAVLIFGVRSLRVVLATFAMLAMGFAWTAAWGMLAIGQFTTLSIIFLVMFFGLGVDFAIHYALRIQESLGQTGLRNSAEFHAARGAAGPIGLCTLTSSIGFLAYLATDYRGLAELGAISAGGMVIALLLTFSAIPAFFGLFGRPRALITAGPAQTRTGFWTKLSGHWRVILALTIVLAGIAGHQAAQMRFDYSVLALRDPDSESMSTLAELKAAGEMTDYSLSILTAADEADLIRERLAILPSVADVQGPADAVPADQDLKRGLLDDAQALLGGALHPVDPRPAPDAETLQSAAADLRGAIDSALADPELTAQTRILLQGLDEALAPLLASPDRDRLLATLDRGATGNVPDLLAWLRSALDARPFEFDELPEAVRDRLVGPAGEKHLVVLPAEDISQVKALNRFIEEVRAVAPSATGRPVAEWGVGNIVVTAFVQALITALVLIFLVVLVTLGNLRDALLVLVPLLLGALFTVATARLIDMPFNMANILVLPLIFGLGVDNGIHLVHRFRRENDLDGLMASSTPRAVLLSALTTAGTFAALSLSPHQGTASIGLLLTIAIGWLLLTTLVLLPVLLERFSPRSPAPT